jgi:transcription initiation factor TFIID subunit 10
MQEQPLPRVKRFEAKVEELSDFLSAVDGYSPTVPLEAVQYYLSKAGVSAEDERVAKVVALATDRFLAKIVEEAKQSAKLRNAKNLKNPRKRKTDTTDLLENADISRSLANHRVHLRRKMAVPAD